MQVPEWSTGSELSVSKILKSVIVLLDHSDQDLTFGSGFNGFNVARSGTERKSVR